MEDRIMTQNADGESFSKGFSILLKRLRREERGWKQKELADKSGLKIRTIQDLETDAKAVLDHETISKLADAFELTGAGRDDFFRAAGLVATSATSQDVAWTTLIQEFYKSMDFPAFVSDELTYVHSLNSYMIELLEINLDTLANVVSMSNEFNAIQFFLDPVFNAKKVYGSHWREYATTNVWFLRNMSRPHIHTTRFQKLFAKLQKLEAFQEMWEAAGQLEMLLPPYLGTVYSTKYGTVRFWHSSAVKPSISGEQMTFLFYHPADADSERAFLAIRTEVPKVAYQCSNTRDKGLVRIF
jgi:transcriptional regulator with XRE-family HTH domain